ncbi:MAG: substrate-binding domain-containing protein [Anaerolineae bacterium]|nr:substrate-binding domain-containing protein [Anaerolineae bacterium]
MSRKQATSQDVADLAGVSRTTVSFVLNNVPGMKISEETRQRVLEAARQLDYYPASAARTLASGKTHRIGLVLCEQRDHLMANAFLPAFLRGVSDLAHQEGYRVIFQSAEDKTGKTGYVGLLREQHVDGLIVSGPRSDDFQLSRLHEEGYPLVLHGHLPDCAIPFVDVDNVGGAHKAVSHLIGLGHRRIGLITNAPLSYTAAQDRLTGYRQALQEAALPLDDELVRYGEFSPQSGRVAMESLLALPSPPSAVFVASDVVALGAMAAVRERGMRIPQDVALVGFDDIFFAAYVSPPLTTVRLPAYGLGWAAGDMLIRLISEDEPVERQMLLESELVIRQSCGGNGPANNTAQQGCQT